MTGRPLDQIDQIDQRLEVLESGFAEYRNQTDASLQELRTLVGELSDITRLHQQALRQLGIANAVFTERFTLFLTQAEFDRMAITENQMQIRRIWEYLMRQHPNG
jgi:hypothetical protein